MHHPDFSFKIADEVDVRLDLGRKRAVISCTTADGKSLHLETNYETLDKLHREIMKQLDRC
jgi:hypothetical protein